MTVIGWRRLKKKEEEDKTYIQTYFIGL